MLKILVSESEYSNAVRSTTCGLIWGKQIASHDGGLRNRAAFAMGLLATKKDDFDLAEALHLEAVLVLDRLPEVRWLHPADCGSVVVEVATVVALLVCLEALTVSRIYFLLLYNTRLYSYFTKRASRGCETYDTLYCRNSQ